MRAVHAMERRLQDLERKFQNKERLGKIVDVKFEKQRWYVKMNDGSDSNPSGGDSGAAAGGGGGHDTFKSDWQPWQSFSHGTIKMSVPPKKGQYALMRSIGGTPELSTVEPHHYGPENPSPHGEKDEVVKLIEDDEDQQQSGGAGGGGGQASGAGGSGGGQSQDKFSTWMRETKDLHHLIIQKKGGGGLGIPANLAGLSNFNLGSLASLANVGNMASMDLSSLANISSIAGLAGIDVSKLTNFVSIAQASIPGISNLGHIGQLLSGAGLSGGGGGGGGGGGAGGGDGMNSKGGQKQQKERKIPEVEEDGDDDTTQVKSTKEFILKTVGKKKSYYKQDKDIIHVRYGEQDEKADILMNENEMVHQFKDKKSKVKWTEEDLTVMFGEDQNSKMVMTENDITMTQGGDSESKVVMTKADITVSQGVGSSKIRMTKNATVISHGNSTFWSMRDGLLEVGVGGTSWTLDASGWSQTGGSVAHNGKLIDALHKHDGVMPGGGLTGLPILPKLGGGGGAPPGDSGSGGLV
jgi:hypothetical protein